MKRRWWLLLLGGPAFCRTAPKHGWRLRLRATPLELLTLPPLETYTSKGVLPAPEPKLPEGKQSVFDGVPLLQTDEGLEASEALGRFAERLGQAEPSDLLCALLLALGLALGLLDTRRRWLSYLSESVTWGLYRASTPGAPSRLGSGDPRDVELAKASWPRLRELLKYLSSARIPDRLRGASAADALRASAPQATPLADAVLRSCAAALSPSGALPRLDGAWECGCDYFRNGAVIPVAMTLRGSRGDYVADGARHELSGVTVGREGSLVVADFCWRNVAGASGRGRWLVSYDGAFIAGQWRQDGVEDGPWSWYGRRKPSLSNPPPPGREETAVPDDVETAAPSVVEAARELVASVGAAEREALVASWERAAPQQPSGTGGDLAPSAVLRRRWLAVGEELRSCLGLTVQGLTPEPLQQLGQALSLLLLLLLSFFLARCLNLALGNGSDAVTWSFFAAAYAAVLDFVLPSRKAFGDAKRQRLRTLRRWEEAGGLLRKGSTPREELLSSARRVLAPGGGDLRDSEIEEVLKVWNPEMRRQVLRSSRRKALVTYENISVVKDKEPRSIW